MLLLFCIDDHITRYRFPYTAEARKAIVPVTNMCSTFRPGDEFSGLSPAWCQAVIDTNTYLSSMCPERSNDIITSALK